MTDLYLRLSDKQLKALRLLVQVAEAVALRDPEDPLLRRLKRTIELLRSDMPVLLISSDGVAHEPSETTPSGTS